MRAAITSAIAVWGLALAANAQSIEALDPSDHRAIEATAQESLEFAHTDEPGVWINPVTGNQGMFTPTSTRYGPGGLVCRDYTVTGSVFGREEIAYGTACRQPDGVWRESGAPRSAPAHVTPYRPAAPPTYAPYSRYTEGSQYAPTWRLSIGVPYRATIRPYAPYHRYPRRRWSRRGVERWGWGDWERSHYGRRRG